MGHHNSSSSALVTTPLQLIVAMKISLIIATLFAVVAVTMAGGKGYRRYGYRRPIHVVNLPVHYGGYGHGLGFGHGFGHGIGHGYGHGGYGLPLSGYGGYGGWRK